jgi:hypothetical protein
MEIQDHVHAARFGLSDGLVEVVPGVGAQRERVGIILQQTVEEGHAHDIEVEAGDGVPVSIGDPVVTEHLHETLFLRGAKAARERVFEAALVRHVALAHHPHLLQEPVADVGALEDDRPAIGVHPPGASRLQHPDLAVVIVAPATVLRATQGAAGNSQQ